MRLGTEKVLSLTSLRSAVVGLAFLIAFWLQPAYAQDVTCQKEDASRRIYVVIENAARGLPCEVIMRSPPAEPQRLWRAEFERGFCAKRLQTIVARLTDNEWRCRPTESVDTKPWQQRWRPVM
jgi:hypothetical protein